MTARTVVTRDSEKFRQKLKLKSLQIRRDFETAYPLAVRFLLDKGLELEKMREYSARLLSAGTLTGALLLGSPKDAKLLPTPQEVVNDLNDKLHNGGDSKSQLEMISELLKAVLPSVPRPLTRNEEKFLEYVISDMSKIKVKAALEGEHLNTTYGFIGLEQHLKRYPGDNEVNHADNSIRDAGIAPGLSAWGYFAPSKEKMSPRIEEIERWYAVVQTLYLPDWDKRQPYLKNWYKYRKVMIVNTANGKAVVAAISDSGPAAWTGKQFGGSPEVMNYLGGKRYTKGAVLVFFVDDPENKVGLGPVDYNLATETIASI